MSKPTLHFFRATPPQLESTPPLASSFQSLETCFFLIALRRYPHALVSCASAIESAIRAKYKVPSEDIISLKDLFEQSRREFSALRSFPYENLKAFREARNKIIHYGFSPDHDAKSVSLLLETGFPFLKKCYREFFNFHLNWRDARPGVQRFADLSPEEKEKVGLLPLLADQLHIAEQVHGQIKNPDTDKTYCFEAFGHFLRVQMKEAFTPFAEASCLDEADAKGDQWRIQEEQKEAVAQQFKNACWEFDCPVCSGCKTVVGEIVPSTKHNLPLGIYRMVCVECGLKIPQNHPFLATFLLEPQIREHAPQILKEFGITERY